MIVLLHFECQPAAAKPACALFDRLQQPPPDAAAAMRGDHEVIRDIDERTCGKGGKAAEADRQAHRLSGAIREKDQGGGVLAQALNDVTSGGFRQRPAITHRVHGIRVEQMQRGRLMVGMGKVSLNDGERHFIDGMKMILQRICQSSASARR